MKLLSYGGGTQSAALALMSAAGDLPRLDAVIFADTHGELPETYSYAEYVADQLRGAEIPFVRVSAGSLESALLASEPTSQSDTAGPRRLPVGCVLHMSPGRARGPPYGAPKRPGPA